MGYIGLDINYGDVNSQTGTGDGSDTTPIATLDYSVPTSSSIVVTLDGVTQVPDVDYNVTSGTTLTFTTAPVNLVKILVVFLGRSLGLGTPADGTVDASKLATNAVTNIKVVDVAGSKLTGTVVAKGDGASTDGKITLNCSQNTHGVSIQSPNHASTADYTLTLPTTNGNADEVLKTDGGGTLSWVAQASAILDSPVITGTLSVVDSGSVSHTVANWSDDVSYTIVPTNCTVGAVNGSGIFVVTHTSGSPSYTIKATTDSLGLADSAVVTKNITMQLSAPTLSSPADTASATNVTYTITSTTANDDKLILNPNTANFTYHSVSGGGTASKVGNTVECVGFGTGNPAVIIQFTAQATYSVTATAVKIDGTYGTSAASSTDSIVIANAIEATGGTIVTYTYDSVDYKFHKFLSTGATNFVISSAPAGKTIDILVISGGGGGSAGINGQTNGGGGGAGGYRWFTAQSPSVATYVSTIGAGGAGGGSATGAKGSNSSFIGTGISITATGGGYGGYNQSAGGTGGCGGGSSGNSSVGGAGNQGGYTPVEGFGGNPGAGHNSSGSGGGGMGAVGVASTVSYGGAGGNGVNNFSNQSSVAFTTAHTKALLDAVSLGEVSGGTRYIGGGGCGGHTNSQAYGGLGGGGDTPASGIGTPGDVNTGSGGGGNGHDQTSNANGAGGSGVILVRYLA